MRRIWQFFKDSYAELKRVTWPTRSEVGSSTKVVIISVFIFAAVLGLIDLILLRLIDALF